MKTLGIIPVRSGSKRFPGKNFSKFNETTLIENTIDKLLKAHIDSIVVSADTNALEMIKGMNIKSNPIVTFITRPSYLAQDDSRIEDVILDVIYRLKTIQPEYLEEDYIIVLAQVTSPNWSPHSLAYSIHRLEDKKVDSVISVSPDYKPNGCFYIIRKSTFVRSNKLYLNNCYLVKLDWEASCDIDYEYQLYIAQALSQGNHDE